MQTVQINTAFNVGLDFEFAPFHKRVLAYGIDFAIMCIYLFGLKYIFYDYSMLNLDREESMGIDILIISLPMLLYSFICELLMNGQTLGKKIMNLRVISLEGGEPTFDQYLLRWVTKTFEWPFLFGYIYSSAIDVYAYFIITCVMAIPVVILVLVTKNKQRLGDLAAGTTLVQTKTMLNLSDTIFIPVTNKEYKPTYPEVMKLSDSDINTINNILNQSRKNHNYDLSMRVETKIKEVLKIESKLSSIDFLEKLMEDYNYLATKE